MTEYRVYPHGRKNDVIYPSLRFDIGENMEDDFSVGDFLAIQLYLSIKGGLNVFVQEMEIFRVDRDEEGNEEEVELVFSDFIRQELSRKLNE